MKVAVTSTGESLNDLVDPRFGRCPFFLIVDTETMETEVVANASTGVAHGAGISAAQSVASKGVKTVITGNVGPNAYQALSAAGVDVVLGARGTVAETVEAYTSGALDPASQPTVGGHFGQSGRGRGRGRRRE
ncbi:MAG: NifB/NifX family molybdenum-iron cluster-binding protein [Candidatus Bathyarchaeia archaeon]